MASATDHAMTAEVNCVLRYNGYKYKLPVQSVPNTTKVVSSKPVHGEVYSIQQYVIKFVSNLR